MTKKPRQPDNANASAADRERYEALLAEAQKIQGVSLAKDAWRRLRKSRAAMASLYFLAGLALVAFFVPVLPLQSPQQQHLKDRKFKPPSLSKVELALDAEAVKKADEEIAAVGKQLSAERDPEVRKKLQAEYAGLVNTHPYRNLWTNLGPLGWGMTRLRLAVFGNFCIPSLCGTDNLGRDILSRIFWGARVSLIVGVVATFVSILIGVTYGAISGYFGGYVDTLMMGFVDILYSIPFIFVVIFLITILNEEQIKEGMRNWGLDQITVFYLVIGAIYWLTMARVVRGQVISLKNEQYIDAARTIGASPLRIVFRHLIPNVMGIVVVYLSLTIPSVVLFESFLSFLGLGVTAPDVSWGTLMNEGVNAMSGLQVFWWLIVFPGIVFATTLFALNFLGDGVRDALDPRLKNR